MLTKHNKPMRRLHSRYMYDFNMLVSCPWAMSWAAKQEITRLLKTLGDENPIVKGTLARGIIGVKTSLDPRAVVQELKTIQSNDPTVFQHTLKWVPVDLWVESDLDSMREAVRSLKDMIRQGERWRMTVEKRRYTLHHKIDIIRELAELVDEQVDLKNPDRIVRIDILGKYAGLSVLSPQEIFSAVRLSSQG